jgi:hypothetical protein
MSEPQTEGQHIIREIADPIWDKADLRNFHDIEHNWTNSSYFDCHIKIHNRHFDDNDVRIAIGISSDGYIIVEFMGHGPRRAHSLKVRRHEFNISDPNSIENAQNIIKETLGV